VKKTRQKENEMTTWPDDDVILYDGVCIFCSRWIRFVATRDVERRFRFTPIQSDYGTRLAQAFGINPDDPDTNAVVHGGVAWLKSDGALTVLGRAGAGPVSSLWCRSHCAMRSMVWSRAIAIASSAGTTSASCPMLICGRG
jgi:predicted DCC family thiol-disulfide oxidoreductase YuxK